MYVCVCKAVTDHQLESAIDQGLCTRKQLIKCFGVGRDCGKCNKEVHALLQCHQAQDLILNTAVPKSSIKEQGDYAIKNTLL